MQPRLLHEIEPISFSTIDTTHYQLAKQLSPYLQLINMIRSFEKIKILMIVLKEEEEEVDNVHFLWK